MSKKTDGDYTDNPKIEDPENKPSSKNAMCFFIMALLWEVAVGVIIGILFGYSDTMSTIWVFNSFIYIVPILLFMVAGFTLMSAYVAASAVTNMTFCILATFFTLQNWFIYRCFWNKLGINLKDTVTNFDGLDYQQISFLPFGNDRQTSDQYKTEAMTEAIGACIALFCALSPILGRINLLEVFLLSWVGPFMYELNSQIFNKFYITDNGFGMRGFLFGGLMGLFITLVIGKRQEASRLVRYASSYHVSGLCFIGTILVCLGYPMVVSSGLQTLQGTDVTLIGVVQINCWFSMGASVVGVYIASALQYKKLYLHDIVFTSLSGAIAYSTLSDINYNPSIPITVGTVVGFFCSLGHTHLKTKLNKGGVRFSNESILSFIIPGMIACIVSSILQAIGGIPLNKNPNRTESEQAGWQLMGFVFSLGCALFGGIILGIIMRRLHRPYVEQLFNDNRLVRQEDNQEYQAESDRSRSNLGATRREFN